MKEYKFTIHKIDRQSNFLKLELSEKNIIGKFNSLGGKIMAQFFVPKGMEMTEEIKNAFVAKAAELLKTKRKK